MGLCFVNKNRNLPIERRSRELARGVWGHAPPPIFFLIDTLCCNLGALKYIYIVLEKNINFTFLRKNIIYDVSWKVHGRNVRIFNTNLMKHHLDMFSKLILCI